MAIIAGFPAIGKSSLCRSEEGKKLKLIDLESSSFNQYNEDLGVMEKIDRWEQAYVNVAKDLSDQGYNVFISTHHWVLEKALDADPYLIMIAPDINLKADWVSRAAHRFANNQVDKNFRALDRIVNHYERDITEFFTLVEKFDIMNSKAYHPVVHRILSANYELLDIVKDALEEHEAAIIRYQAKE